VRAECLDWTLALGRRHLLRLSQLLHDRPDDARARKDDVRALGLQADDHATSLGVARAVELDLAVDLGSVQDRALDEVGIVSGQTEAVDTDRAGVGSAAGARRAGPPP
jgi:hypothetical protein